MAGLLPSGLPRKDYDEKLDRKAEQAVKVVKKHFKEKLGIECTRLEKTSKVDLKQDDNGHYIEVERRFSWNRPKMYDPVNFTERHYENIKDCRRGTYVAVSADLKQCLTISFADVRKWYKKVGYVEEYNRLGRDMIIKIPLSAFELHQLE